MIRETNYVMVSDSRLLYAITGHGRGGIRMKTILVADDDATTLHLIVEVLKPMGYNIVTASNGQEAIQQAEHHRPDLLILDVLMPQGHGFEVCGKLRQRSEFDSTKILILTAKAYPADRNQAMQVGADSFMTKPFVVGDLRKTVTDLLAEQEE
ncbi:MAG: response regulator [Candidatus Tectomicrobia bacterium]|nr:response regulator [Candidatus Tectomicrobia bacterium]